MKLVWSKIKSHKRGTLFFGIWAISLVVLMVTLVGTIFAAPPTSAYNPGDTLNPSCAPGDTNCTVNAPLSGSGTTGYIPFYTASSSVVTSTTSFFWDNTNGFLGVGTSTPTSTLHVVGTSRFSATSTFLANLSISGTITAGTWNGSAIGVAYGGTATTTTPGQDYLLIGNGTNYDLRRLLAGSNITISTSTAGQLTITGSSAAESGFRWASNVAYLSTSTDQFIIGTSTIASGLKFAIATGTVVTATSTYFAVDGNGNVGIGTTTPATTLSVVGSLTLSNALSVANGGTGSTTVASINGLAMYGSQLTFATSGLFGFSISTSSNTLTFTHATSTASQSGFLSSADWTTFNAKQASITIATSGVTGLSISSSTNTWTFTIATSTASVSGFLSAADFTTFNSKVGTSTINGIAPNWTFLGTANQVTIASSGAQFTWSLPQNIDSTAAPTFASATLSNFTGGSILFATTSGVLTQNNANLYWDDANVRFGVGTSTPMVTLAVVGSSTISNSLNVDSGSLYVGASNNRVGIGTTAPGSTLDVRSSALVNNIGSVYGSPDFRFWNSGVSEGDAIIALMADNGGNSYSGLYFGDYDDGDIGAIVYDHGNNALITRVNASEAMRINSSGRIGIGTTTPISLLALNGGAPVLSFTNSSSTGKTFQFRNGEIATTTFDIYDFSSSTSRLAIDTNGLLSIGTTTAAARFFIGSSTTSYLFAVNDSGNIIIGTSTAAASNALLTIASTTATNILTVLDNGRIGIGTTTPSYLLDVTNASGTLLAVDGSANPTYLFDIQNTAGTSLFTVTATSGAVTVALPGTGTANALCHTNATATTTEEIVDCTSNPAADYMEMYSVATGTEPGDLVVTSNEFITTKDGEQLTKLTKSNSAYQANVLGIVSDPTKAGDFNSVGHNIAPEDNPMPVALSGRVFVKTSLENGPIKAGDLLAASSHSGVAMKATGMGMTIGMALQDFPSTSSGQTDGATSTIAKVLVFVGQKFSLGSQDTNSSTTLAYNDYWETDRDSLIDEFTKAIQWTLSKLGLALDHGIAKLKEVFAEKVTTKELCVGETCVNEDQLKTLINNTPGASILRSPTSEITPSQPLPKAESATSTEQAATSTEPIVTSTPPEISEPPVPTSTESTLEILIEPSIETTTSTTP